MQVLIAWKDDIPKCQDLLIALVDERVYSDVLELPLMCVKLSKHRAVLPADGTHVVCSNSHIAAKR